MPLQSPSPFSGGDFDYEPAKRKLEELTALMQAEDFWNDADKAKKISAEHAELEKQIHDFETMTQEFASLKELIDVAEKENDDALLTESESLLSDLEKKTRTLLLSTLFSDPADPGDCFLEIHAGAGGTEAQDWADILLRMYTRYADSKDYKVDTMEESAGDEAGIKSATIKISGFRAYGWLKSENGVHRLVRISPFDSNARRHTSFASVYVYPDLDDDIQIVINEKDCKIDTYRSSGAGGQHVNKTDSAVRITHIPTGIVVACQNQRSQLQNREQAWKMLRAKLYELEVQKREAEQAKINEAKTEIGWGHQIRSYVLQPYQMVKDLRTNVETSDTKAVLDGEIDLFLEASLASKLTGLHG